MKIIKIPGISFPVAEYEIIRYPMYSDPEILKLYIPTGMKFYCYLNSGSRKSYIGLLEWSEENETLGEDNFEVSGKIVGNAISLTTYHIKDKYIIWDIPEISFPAEEEELPGRDDPEKFKSPIYLLQETLKEDLDVNQVFKELEDLAGKPEAADYIKECHRPLEYYKLHGLSDKGGLDSTSVITGIPRFPDLKVSKIERRDVNNFHEVDPYPGFTEWSVRLITEEEYEKAFTETLRNIKE